MDTQTILNEMSLIFREVLKRENIVLDNETTAQDVEGWDSLTNMYGAQNETYIEGWEKKTSNLLIYKRLCKI